MPVSAEDTGATSKAVKLSSYDTLCDIPPPPLPPPVVIDDTGIPVVVVVVVPATGVPAPRRPVFKFDANNLLIAATVKIVAASKPAPTTTAPGGGKG